jgi:hypothetical protein
LPTSRRGFLRGSAIVSAGVALGAIPKAAVAGIGSDTHNTIETVASSSNTEIQFTRGIGVYPGNPREDFGPEFVTDNKTYRNLALLRPAYHSSSYDYNLTAQLVTDGIKDTHLPDWVATSASSIGVLPKVERELILDHQRTSSIEVRGARASVQVQLGGKSVPEIDRIDVIVIPPFGTPPSNLEFTVSISDDARNWTKTGSVSAPGPVSVEGYPKDFARQGQLYIPSIPLSPPARSRFYQIECAVTNSLPQFTYMQWKIGEVLFFSRDQRVNIGGPYSFTSAWMSAGLGEEWIYVDLGARCEFDRVKLYWIARAAKGTIQVSDDIENWRDVQTFAGQSELVDDIKLSHVARGRYVRVLMERPTSSEGYILSEFEVFGRGGPVVKPKAAPDRSTIPIEGRFHLAGYPWRVQRSSLVNGEGKALSMPGFSDDSWLVATVPATVLCSYLNAGAIPNPDYGKNQLYISDSFFYSDFWYRTEFDAPSVDAGKMIWLNFDGINWKAEVFLNGEGIGRIEGAFKRGRFDVSGKLRPGAKNAIAIRIEKNATPGSCKQKTWESNGPNGGALGADNPTYHASVGWDWIPTIRGRNTGIIGNVYLTTSGAVTLWSPFVTTSVALPDVSPADVSIEVDLLNHRTTPVSGTVRARFGTVEVAQKVTLGGSSEGSSRSRVKLDPSTHADLRLQNPKLWWPVGYGDPYLYDVEISFETDDGKRSDATKFKTGIRQMSYKEDDGALRIWINGRRFIPRGGNWGFSESMLRYRAREYDAALRYHREMNFNMIRNWVGQIGDDEFYEACDRYGVMVWQDFWLANPWDGPNPDDNSLFLDNVKDTVLRIRNHASIALYCGRNEGFPPKALDDGLRSSLADLHPGLHYIPNSAEEVVGGGGPYWAMPLTYYPTMAAYPKLHSEIGIPNIPSVESVRAMMPENALWPQGLEWGLHDFCEGGSRHGPNFLRTIEEAYGDSNNLEEWVSLAHFADYEGFRAEFEAQSQYRMGLLLWMSHPCWPSLLWQTYDYNLEPTAAYFACKNVCEPLHIQWNRVTETIEVVNYSAGDVHELSAGAEVLNMDGTTKWKKSTSLDLAEDNVSTCFPIEYPEGLTPVHFIRLTLSRAGTPISTNLYMRGAQEGNYRAIRQLAPARVKASTTVEHEAQIWKLRTQLRNLSPFPALMVRLKVVREKSGDRILPVIYSDNYVTLMPGEQRAIDTEVNHADTRGEKPRMVIGGFNVETA